IGDQSPHRSCGKADLSYWLPTVSPEASTCLTPGIRWAACLASSTLSWLGTDPASTTRPLVVVTSTLLPGVADAISEFTAVVIWLSEATGSLLVAAGPAPVAASWPVCAAACLASAGAPAGTDDVMSLEDGAGVTLFEALSAEATRIPELPVLLRVLATWRSVPSFVELLVVGGDAGAAVAGAADGAGGGTVTV